MNDLLPSLWGSAVGFQSATNVPYSRSPLSSTSRDMDPENKITIRDGGAGRCLYSLGRRGIAVAAWNKWD